jgi:glycosyltransferase involved in cell wall biosynthesis
MTIAVVLLTYNRLEYAKRTLRSLAEKLESNEHNFVWHIASDGDTAQYLAELGSIVQDYANYNPTITNAQQGGYGKSYNLAMQSAHSLAEWVMPIEDDWELVRTFNPDGIIRDMAALGIGCARLGYMGYTQELRGKLERGAVGHWLRFDSMSEEPHVFAGHPRIESRDWSRNVGPWPEGLLPGETEFAVAHRRKARINVAWPCDAVKMIGGDLFAHIGTLRSW